MSIDQTEKERYETALSLLNEISGIILEKRDYEDVLNRIIERVTRAFDARAGSIAVPDDQKKYLKYIAGFNKNPELMKRLNTTERLQINEGVAGRAYARETMSGVSNVFDDNIFKEKFYEHAKREGFKAIFSFPLIAFGNCIGVATLYYGEPRTFDDSLRKILKPVSNQIAIAMLQSDLIDNLEESNTRLKKRAETDGLTGLFNHEKIQNVLRYEINRSSRYSAPISCIMADIDHFKEINDTFGHPFGDRVLDKISGCFLDEKRDVDAVGRYGGEEFLFVLPETGEDRAFSFAERVRMAVEGMDFEYNNRNVQVTVSLGIAEYARGQQDTHQLIKRADQALLAAKQNGRNRSVRFSDLSGDHSGSSGETETQTVST